MKAYISSNLSDLKNILKEFNIQTTPKREYADFLILHSIDELKKDKKFVIFVRDKYNLDEMEKFSEKGDYRYLKGYFLKDELIKKDKRFIEALKEIEKKLNKQEKLLKLEKQAKKIKFTSILEITNVDQFKINAKSRKFISLFLDKPMFKMMMGLNAILDSSVKNNLKNIVENYQKNIANIKKEKDFKEKFFNNIILKTPDYNTDEIIEPVLLTGSTGTGKTLIARWIYNELKNYIGDNIGVFQEVNASCFSKEMFETELFGFMKGSFTDAEYNKPGKALLSFGGVLFIDEIGDTPIEVQPKILKFLEEMKFTPAGWKKSEMIYSPQLIIAATNRDLSKEINNGNFRKDLLARFRKRINIPDLSERKNSIKILAVYCFLKEIILNNYKEIKYIEEDAFDVLKKMDFSSENFRTLERIVARIIYKTRKYNLNTVLAEIVKEIGSKEKILEV